MRPTFREYKAGAERGSVLLKSNWGVAHPVGRGVERNEKLAFFGTRRPPTRGILSRRSRSGTSIKWVLACLEIRRVWCDGSNVPFLEDSLKQK